MTRKRNIVNDQWNVSCDVENKIIYNTEILKSNLGHCNDAYILLRANVTIIGYQVTQVALRHCATFIKSITKIDETTSDNAEDLHLVMPMLNIIEYSSTYSESTWSLWCYSKDEATNLNAGIANVNNFKSFMHKSKLLYSTEAGEANRILKNATFAVPLKYLSNFWRSLEMLLINCKVELKLKWTKYFILSAAGANNAKANSNNISFIIKSTKLYVSVEIQTS